MKAFFTDLFNYHRFYNAETAKLLQTNLAQIPADLPALFSHMLNAHQIWNSRILETNSFGVHQLHPPDSWLALDETNYRDSLWILENRDLLAKIAYRNTKGESFENSIQEILFHAANHHSHHRAQIMRGLREAGIPPLTTDYIFYKRKPL